MVLILILSSLGDFIFSHVIEKGFKRTGLILSLCMNLAFLGFFKYANFFIENLNILSHSLWGSNLIDYVSPFALPIGISFFTFQTMSYTIDVYLGRVKASRSLINFGTYVSMFPQLVAGPIVRYSDIKDDLINKKISLFNVSKGIERFAYGLFKKVIIADNLGRFSDVVFSDQAGDLNTPVAWLGILAYSFQIYFDFSGYSDMAIGLCRMLGINIPENFNYPYISRSIRDFWRRWHISLSTWFRDYVYIPLGGNKKGKKRTYINLFIVFFVTGMWHGASWNFIFWGLFHGLFLILERIGFGQILSKLPKPLSWLYTFLVVIIGWVFFRCDDLTTSFAYISTMFIDWSFDPVSILVLENIDYHLLVVFGLALILSTPLFKVFEKHVTQESLIRIPLIFILLFISFVYISGNDYSPFIYFRF